MKGERVSTEEAAWIMGASAGWVREKMRLGQLPIGIYSKNIVNGEVIETNLLDNSVVKTSYTNQNSYKIS